MNAQRKIAIKKQEYKPDSSFHHYKSQEEFLEFVTSNETIFDAALLVNEYMRHHPVNTHLTKDFIRFTISHNAA